jgi:hypothetical protein
MLMGLAFLVAVSSLSLACLNWSAGVLANVLFPTWLITMLLLLLLLFLTHMTVKKAIKLHRCEVEYLAQRKAEGSSSSSEEHSQPQGAAGTASEPCATGPQTGDSCASSSYSSHGAGSASAAPEGCSNAKARFQVGHGQGPLTSPFAAAEQPPAAGSKQAASVELVSKVCKADPKVPGREEGGGRNLMSPAGSMQHHGKFSRL